MTGPVALEIRRALRAPRSRWTIGALAAATLAACLVGGAVARVHRRAGQRDVQASRRRIAASRDRSAFELAAWQDTLIARGIGPLSFLAASEMASLPDAAVVRIYEPPTMVPALAERSPAATLLGTLDLVWVLTLLLPLGAIGLGYDAISRDRAVGTLAMMLVPARRPGRLVVARTVGLFIVLLLAVVPAALAGAFAGSRLAGTGIDPFRLAILTLLLVTWCLLLASAVVGVSALTDRPASSLALAAGGWLLLSVAVPLAVNNVVQLAYPPPDPRPGLQGEQAAAEVFNRPSESIVETEVERDPRFDPDFAADAATSQMRYYFLLSRERYRRAKGARHAADRALTRRVELAEIASLLTPPSVLSAALSDLAGAGPSERISFAEDAEAYRAGLERFVGERVLADEPVFSDANVWPTFERSPAAIGRRPAVAALLFVLLSLGCAFAGGLRLARGSPAPTKEDS